MLPACVQATVSGNACGLQVNPASTLQADEQPSPLTMLPSSQSSPVSTLALPQLVSQARVVTVPVPERQTGSCVQVFEQPVASP